MRLHVAICVSLGVVALGAAQQHQVKPDTLPKPFATPDAKNPPAVVPQPEGVTLKLPSGFSSNVFAEGGFKRMRWIAVAPGGDVFAAIPTATASATSAMCLPRA
jgi:glucose/arabinose dehydrogenase